MLRGLVGSVSATCGLFGFDRQRVSRNLCARLLRKAECKLRIFHVNDIYRLDNFAALQSCIDALSSEDGVTDTLKLCGGDFLAPSLLSNIDHGRGPVRVLNAIGFDAVIFGNHECDVPDEELFHRINELEASWVNSNMTSYTQAFEGSKLRRGKCPPMLRVPLAGGRSVVLLGFNCGGRGTPYEKLYKDGSFSGHASAIVPTLDAAPALVAQARAAYPDADLILPMTHQDLADDVKLAQMRLGLPLILGGHDHLGDASSAVVGATHVCKASENLADVVVVDLVWGAHDDAVGGQPAVSVRRVPLASPGAADGQGAAARGRAHYPPHPLVERLVERVEAPLEAHRRYVLLECSDLPVALKPAERRLSSVDARRRECSVGCLLATALREAATAARVLGPDGPISACHAALINGGSIRGNAEYEARFTYGDLLQEMPFTTPYYPVQLPGAVLSAAVEFSRNTWGLREGEPGFDPKAGKALHCDDGVTLNHKHQVVAVAGEPLDPQRVYTVLMEHRLTCGSNVPLQTYCQQHPDRLTDPENAGPPQNLIEDFCRRWRERSEALNPR